MNYYLYKLSFRTPVHFGADVAGIGVEKCSLSCHADTLFSAICNELLILKGSQEIEKWKKLADNDQFFISDLFPYYGNDLFLPKPALTKDPKTYKQDKDNKYDPSKSKKIMKKLKYIPAVDWELYRNYLNGIEDNFSPTIDENYFAEANFPKVSIPRTEKENNLYSVGAYCFSDSKKIPAGLYFIAYFAEDNYKSEFDQIINSLQYSGIGGERSSGYGKFHYTSICQRDLEGNDPQNILFDMLKNTEQKEYKMTLSVIAPKENEITMINNSFNFYTLIPRKGFVFSDNYSEKPIKRKETTMINAGSCFKTEDKIIGQVIDVSKDGNHSVYRYGKAMMVGV